MSRSRFLGREPVERTEFVYDDTGRLVEAITTRDPEWDDDDRAWAIALAEIDADTCRGCGHQLSETTQPGLDEAYDVRFVVCQACAARGRLSEDRHNPGEIAIVTRIQQEVN